MQLYKILLPPAFVELEEEIRLITKPITCCYCWNGNLKIKSSGLSLCPWWNKSRKMWVIFSAGHNQESNPSLDFQSSTISTIPVATINLLKNYLWRDYSVPVTVLGDVWRQKCVRLCLYPIRGMKYTWRDKTIPDYEIVSTDV